MSKGHRTSAVARPRTPRNGDGRPPRRGRRRSAGPTDEPSLLADLTTPIRADRRLVNRRFDRWLVALGALGVIGALLAALFVLPVQAYLRQEDDLVQRRAELAVLERANAELEAEVLRLETPEGAAEAAREELGLVDEGEIRVSILPSAGAPLTLPAGFPYDAIAQIIQVRSAPPPAATPAPAPTAAP